MGFVVQSVAFMARRLASMLSRQEEEAERIATLRNDARVREQAQQGTTFKAFADADAEIPGRFHAVASARVVGSTPNVAAVYPAASAAHQTELPRESSLGYSVNDLEPSASLPAAEDTGGAAAPSPPGVEPAPPPAIGGELTPRETIPACGSSPATVGSSPTNPERR
jgi:hypothetical protein